MAVGLLFNVLLAVSAVATKAVWLADQVPLNATNGFRDYGRNQNVLGEPLRLAGTTYERGFGAHAPSSLVYELGGRYSQFKATIGIDDAMASFGHSSVVFKVYADDRLAFRSGTMLNATPPCEVEVGVEGVEELRLVVEDAGDGMDGDHADWAEARLEGATQRSPVPAPNPVAVVAVPRLRLSVAGDGHFAGAQLDGQWVDLRGGAALRGCRDTKPAAWQRRGRGLLVRRELTGPAGQPVELEQLFMPEGGALRWDLAITSPSEPWSCPIDNAIEWPSWTPAQVWTGWQDPVGAGDHTWRDPLAPQAFGSRQLSYGAPSLARVPSHNFQAGSGDLTTLPMWSVLAEGAGLSLVQSPRDALLDVELHETRTGRLVIRRQSNRLGGGHAVRFRCWLVPHDADWRAALAWLRTRFTEYFVPALRLPDQVEGCLAYSGDETPPDSERLAAMGFKVNWKLGDDFAYMGMFIPPITSADERWNRASDEGGQPGKGADTSAKQLNDYCRWMREHGFAVLSYFNTNEFGRHLALPFGQPSRQAEDPLVWQDPLSYIMARFPDGPVQPLVSTWMGSVCVDPGDGSLAQHYVEQARRNVLWLPDASGVCIDRLDWLRLYNAAGDDGLSLYQGRPARSLAVSWQRLAPRLAHEFHRGDQVMLANLMHPRLDLARYLDGIAAEFGHLPTVLNGLALLSLDKPLLCWTTNDDHLSDEFFQRYLHLGAWPTAPYPNNNHCIQPSPERDRWYQDYGPLFDQLRGRSWVLATDCLRVQGARANVFTVRDGWLVTVTGGTTDRAEVSLRGLPHGLRWQAWRPGQREPEPVRSAQVERRLVLEVPLSRGCAVLRGTRE